MDIKLLEQALLLARDILNSVDRQVDAREKEHELIEIYNKLDARSSALYKGKKFKVSWIHGWIVARWNLFLKIRYFLTER